MPDPFAKFRACSCLSCELILTVLDRQCEAHRTGWKTNEVLHALAGCRPGTSNRGGSASACAGQERLLAQTLEIPRRPLVQEGQVCRAAWLISTLCRSTPSF